ncbi:efflux RND transporter periplasmic adaptor subunit [Luteibacter aegosomaticola]|uniref:efflux RND transporter periplasmic adaptor subunit n=1 Tax=Luteibacter aegosomaticola TaxID=2911538 RepID=UPI001FF96BD3|nr:efflux RND transporter periplasmic adaptor subunit [Luteibacter aegosomaticola]UPG90518.1 efflux RND transporter periplasmic adaptor subunit [Luteibacter aegosomaticola]
MNPLPHRTPLLAAGLALALAACHKQEAAQPPPPPQVGVVKAEPRDVPLVQDQVGRISAFRTADVRARVPGILQHRLYAEGTDVKAGQPLFAIDPAPLQAELDAQLANLASARATAVNAKAQADRARSLIGKNYVSRSDLDTAEATERTSIAAVKQGEAAVQSARINLSYARVVAPIDGRAGKQQVTEGALVGQGDTTLLTQVDELDRVYVNFSMSVTDLDRLRAAAAQGTATLTSTDQATVRIQLPDGSDFGETGQLDFSSATVNPQTGTVDLRALLTNANQRLLPGQYVTVKATLGDQHHVFLLPQAAVQRDANETFVLVVGEGKTTGADGKTITVPSAAVRRSVTVDRTDGPNWVVTSGVQPGDQVIVEGIPQARANAPVKAVAASHAP